MRPTKTKKGEGAEKLNVSIESLLRSSHSVGNESDTEKEQAEENDKEKEKDRAG
jgi:hypothetical protein